MDEAVNRWVRSCFLNAWGPRPPGHLDVNQSAARSQPLIVHLEVCASRACVARGKDFGIFGRVKTARYGTMFDGKIPA
ncbi:hypothetical protein MPSYJ_04020 [Mycolicibacterium psychrotolerans]|uniref:Uncharacterized protein n=1 Tax=Mycolicibacterium psychrotolerans TaxID=216929 RepID=A0A7I7M437_9MYCO|nr:hypothetical protein MPSYJ_04020 [Mycolicibacterium psychrotolerans]